MFGLAFESSQLSAARENPGLKNFQAPFKIVAGIRKLSKHFIEF